MLEKCRGRSHLEISMNLGKDNFVYGTRSATQLPTLIPVFTIVLSTDCTAAADFALRMY